MYRRPKELREGRGRYCSRRCRNTAHPPPGGPNPAKGVPGGRNGAWKGGVTYRRKRGNYPPIKYIRAPGWAKPMARKDGYIMEHRLLMAQMVGRLLTRTEVVHHRDHNPLNNELSNLELWPTNQAHKLAEHGRFVEGAVNRLPGSGLL